MQKYAKKMLFIICLFLASTMWYQPDNAEDTAEIVDNENIQSIDKADNFESEKSNNQAWFNIACVPSYLTRHGLDTDLRKRGLSQFTKNIHAQRQGHHSTGYRCYFKVNPNHIGCFNPQLITKEYLDENGYDATRSFPGGAPGQMCYFKKKFVNSYNNLITILKRNGSVHDLNNHIVPSAGAAVQKLSQNPTVQNRN